MFNNFVQQINTPNVSGNGHSVILAFNKSTNYVMILILNSQRPFLTTWYTLLARAVHVSQPNCTGWYNFGCENCTWWYLLFQLEKKGWTKFFKGGLIFQKILVPPDHFFLKYLVRGDCFWGDQLLRDRTLSERWLSRA